MVLVPNAVPNNGENIYWALLSITNSGDYYWDCGGNFDSSHGFERVNTWSVAFAGEIISNSWQLGYVFYNSFSLVYEDDYDGGEPIPPDPPDPIEESDYVPNIYVSVAVNWKATFYDQNFFTTDAVPFTCSEGLAPIIYYEIWDMNDGETLLYSGSSSSTIPIEYQFESQTYNQDFRIVSWYYCGEPPEVQFTESSYYDFVIDATGRKFIIGLESCLVDGFPFINMESCLAGLDQTLQLLSFQLLNPVNQDLQQSIDNVDTSQCYELQVLDEWIHLENPELCPAFTDEIRNTVTPFVTFIVAATIFFFISRGRGVVL